MHIHLESVEKNAVQAYSENEVKIDSIIYTRNFFVSASAIDENWQAEHISALDEQAIAPLLAQQPEIIILGHKEAGKFPPMQTIQHLANQRIGIECMSIGAACRTFNVLLSENRKVILGILF
ncbi:Mth938-like domain-containing protein [Legionella dresdenensis]|uniref:Mth938-like domain-containing protein n=1 Tax=Legionella dresdenensis TaxID=450200 RepID=A0ABV8CBK6_9GAMM